eukprot:6481295-Amphidinium_carterae.2
MVVGRQQITLFSCRYSLRQLALACTHKALKSEILVQDIGTDVVLCLQPEGLDLQHGTCRYTSDLETCQLQTLLSLRPKQSTGKSWNGTSQMRFLQLQDSLS